MKITNKLKQLTSFASALMVSLSGLFIIAVPKALAATATWDSGGSDENFSTAANWVGDVVPSTGDDLVFDNTGLTSDETLNNDLSSISLTSIAFQGSGSSRYTITGNPITLSGGINNASDDRHSIYANLTLTGNQSFTGLLTIGQFSGPGTLDLGSSALTLNVPSDPCLASNIDHIITGSGSLVKAGLGAAKLNKANIFTGVVNVNQGKLSIRDGQSLGTSAGGTTVNDGATLGIAIYEDTTISEPLTFGGNGNVSSGALNDYAYGCVGGGGAPDPRPIITLSGDITLTANTTVSLGVNDFKITGALSGAYTISVTNGSSGQLIVAASSNTSQTPNGTVVSQPFETTYSTSAPAQSIYVSNKETAIVTGTVGSTTVSSGGILKGTGTVGALSVNNGGKVAPGLSPGCISSGNLTFVSGSTYDFEVGGTTECTQYDQIKVTGTVDLGNGTLNTILFNGFQPATGQTYKIVDNDAADAVTGTFNGLAEGATFTVGGYVLKISYVGGDGNDVVLSVQNVPTAPDTGFKLLTTNPLVTLTATTLAASAIALIARRYNRASVK